MGSLSMSLELIIRSGQRALILVHNKALLQQWLEVINELLQIDAGQIGDGKWETGEKITVCMIQTLSKREEKPFNLVLSMDWRW